MPLRAMSYFWVEDQRSKKLRRFRSVKSIETRHSGLETSNPYVYKADQEDLVMILDVDEGRVNSKLYLLPNEALQAGTLFSFYLDPVSNDPLVRTQPLPPSADLIPADWFGNSSSSGHVELAQVIALSPLRQWQQMYFIQHYWIPPCTTYCIFKQKFKFRGEEYIPGT